MKKMERKIDLKTKSVLEKCWIRDNILFLPEQLTPELYKKVNQVLAALDAKWDKRIGGHKLAYDISQELGQILKTGVYYDWRKDTQYYPTPKDVLRFTDYFIPYEYDSHIKILEPSAGEGAILDFLKDEFPNAELSAVEINPKHVSKLKKKGYAVTCGNFLEYNPDLRFDLIVMNPPFEEGVQHIMHAYSLLKVGGTVVSVIDSGIYFRTDGKYREWNQFIKGKYISSIKLPKNAFKESGTNVNTAMIGLTKGKVQMRYFYYNFNGKHIVEISNIPDSLYGITTAVVDVERFLKGENCFPCGSGNDIQLSQQMREEILKLLEDSKKTVQTAA